VPGIAGYNREYVFVSEDRSRDIAEEALATGAGGYVVKSDAGSELLPAIKAVLEGKRLSAPVWQHHFFVAATLTTGPTVHLSWILSLISGIR
jgi:DNA-binding NarL/FixJ family response regulator